MEFQNVQSVSKRRYPVVMRFRCSDADVEIAKRRAGETGSSLSTYLRKRAIGGHTNQPIQDSKDLAELRQHMGLLKLLVKDNSDIRPALKSIEMLILKMTEKIG